MNLFIFPLIQSAVALRKSSTLNALSSVILIAIFSTLNILALFGTYIGQGNSENLLHTLIREAIRDYECAGSNVWVYLCLHIIPSLIVLIKILTN
jgi:hypothetical protein